MNRIGTRTIETNHCTLRRIEPDDYRMMYDNWAEYEEVCRYFPFNSVDNIEIYKEKVRKWSEEYESNLYFKYDCKDSGLGNGIMWFCYNAVLYSQPCYIP